MAVFVGFDRVDVAFVGASLDAHGDRSRNRIHTEEERDECRMDTSTWATRFAADEAAMRAFGRADKRLPWQS